MPLIRFAPYIHLYQIGQRHYNQEEVAQELAATNADFDQRINALREEDASARKINRLESQKTRKVNKLEKKFQEGNLLMRLGEPLAIYDSSLTMRTKEQMELFIHSKGFFHSSVEVKERKRRRFVYLRYQINEGQPFIIDQINYISADTALLEAINQDPKAKLLKKGDIYDQANLTAERDRIDALLKNKGYYNFNRQFINYEVDTLKGNNTVDIDLSIRRNINRSNHKQYRIDSVIFVTDQNVDIGGSTRRLTSTYNGITYSYFRPIYNERILDRRVFIYPDSLYSQQNTFDTQRQLANIDIFKFINIYYDTTGGQFVANIFTSPLKKFQTSNEVGFNITQGFPGPFYNLTFKNRNVFGGLEILEFNGRVGIEGVAAASNPDGIYQSQELGLNMSLIFPQFLMPVGDRVKKRLGDINPKTRLLTGYNFINRPEYIRRNFKTSFSYNWQNRKGTLFTFTPADLNYIGSVITLESFEQTLRDLELRGNSLIRTFQPSFVSSTMMSAIFNFGGYGGGGRNRSSFLRLFGEVGGTSLNLFGTEALENNNLEFYKFVKFNADFRRNVPLNYSNNNIIAYRFNVGVAVPYGENKILPYEKYFFAGGSNSIRAWLPRRLGPGSYTPPENENPDADGRFNYALEQPGDMLLEASIEYRRKLVGFLSGALFIDAGNSWTIRDDSREGATFNPATFYRDIAIGSGFGIRLDFSFLIVRFDFGTKLYDPARPLGERWLLDKISWRRPFGEANQTILNLGIGYPF